MTDEEMDALVIAMDGKPGDFFCLQQIRKNWFMMYWSTPSGTCKTDGSFDKNEYRFVWVTEFPLLEWSEKRTVSQQCIIRSPC